MTFAFSSDGGAVTLSKLAVAPAQAAVPLWSQSIPFAAEGLFLIGMVGAGYAMGRLLGDEYTLFPFLQAGSRSNSEEAKTLVQNALTAVERGEPIPHLKELMDIIDGPEAVDRLFSDDRLEPLLVVLERPLGSGDPSTSGKREDVYTLLAHVATMAVEPLRVAMTAAMARGLGRHRHLVPHLVEVARRDPSVWNDIQLLVDHAANLDPGIQRFLEAHADAEQPFVKKANELFLKEMERFRRLCEDRSAGMGVVVDGELVRMVQREFTVLEVAGTPSKRFAWLASQARVLVPLLDEDRLEILIESAQRGAPDACGLAAQIALVHLQDEASDPFIDETIDALGYGSMRYLTAADALLGFYGSLTQSDLKSPRQHEVRRRAYTLLQRAGAANFEVRAMLRTHGLSDHAPPDLTEEEATLEATHS